ncbi:hypothetical protein OHA91_22910 [Streptomyces erythrochromogenes]|uniref:Lsr2 protein n=1 Tax=Streptomyces erythrochromogenes TaxID=285574 RepID=A0ABZ1QEN5_9ACTN|nr:hypothetical protein [Streptomyces erythrochromogenes]
MQVTTKTLIAMHRDGLSDQAIADRTGVELAAVERIISAHQNEVAAHRAGTLTPPRPAPVAASAPSATPDVADLLSWAADHPSPSIRTAGVRASTALDVLQNRRRQDAELEAVTSNVKELEARIEKLRARAAELRDGQKTRQVKPRDYVPAEVRAWAREEGIPCPVAGVVPASVVAAWRASHATS